MAKRLSVKARLAPDGLPFTVHGRDAWAFLELIGAGPKGCTPIDNPGPRWSAYVFNLRALGLPIETRNEAHKGPFAGTHARYILQCRVEVLESNADDGKAVAA